MPASSHAPAARARRAPPAGYGAIWSAAGRGEQYPTALFHGEPNSLTKDVEKLRSQLQQNPEGLEARALRAKQKEQALAYIDEKLHFISWHNPQCEEHEEKEEAARQAAAALPSPEVLDKIMRCVTKLERQLYRAMNQLERL